MRVRPAELSVEIDDQRHELQPRVMQVLVALARARPSVVSRDKLVDLCWEGRIVGDDSVNRCILALRHLAQQAAPAPFSIETVPRVGYRLVEQSHGDTPVAAQRTALPRSLIMGAVLAVLIAAAGLLFWQQRGAEAEPASIAVLPFRNLSTSDPYFAQGISEEIVGQLAREPHFRVAGSISTSQLGPDADTREVARRLDVDYVVEGSVRRQANRVRVDAGLVRASDGVRLWSDTYDGKLDDIFAIQQRIGSGIASALRRKLVRAPVLSGPLITNGEAYAHYLTARALIRTNNRRMGPAAVDFLKDAIRIDPGYAPAWAGLASAVSLRGALTDHESHIASLREARRYARHALRLSPDLAEGHLALARTFGHGDPQGVAHLKRAAALDPNSAENLIGLGTALGATGEFEAELATYRRAHEVEPLWYRTTGATTIAAAKLNGRAQAEAFAGRGMPDKDANLHLLLGRVAWIFADYSEAARRWSLVVRSNSPRWGHTAQRTLHDAQNLMGVRTGPLIDVPTPPPTRDDWRKLMDAPPSSAVWQQRNRDPIAAAAYRKHNLVAAKLMLNAGRWRELVTTYDGSVGIQGIRPGRRLRVDQLSEAPVVALALRAGGRSQEAERLLRDADSITRNVYRKGKVPFWFDAQSAAIFAALGKKGEALSTLERAFDRGWRQSDGADLRNLADEPVWRSLHGEPRFERLRARITAHYAQERQEMLRLPI
ncbi:MAG TPA: winged helix-turn-helix domain-containing protein [Sphingomicrobium sp.]|nr:winged helix-turn-helix domain-containing protein [Sphingomicrobium sp.]